MLRLSPRQRPLRIHAHAAPARARAPPCRYIGESARVVREMFGYAKEHAPCVIFMDEIDAIGGKRTNEGSSAGERDASALLPRIRMVSVCPFINSQRIYPHRPPPPSPAPRLPQTGRSSAH